MKKITTIIGPTASGKTELSLKLAKKQNAIVISADSKQIYKGMDIGTGKVSKKIQNQIPHFGIDLITPDKEFSVAEFKKYAEKIIDNSEKPVILVGGTGLYVDAIVNNQTFPEIAPNQKFREEKEHELKKYGLEKLQQELFKIDPEAENHIDKKNPRRIIRALEICAFGEKKYSDYQKPTTKKYETIFLTPKFTKESLHKKIEKRVDQMISDGLIEETKNILKKYTLSPTAKDILGYKQIIEHLNNETSESEAIEKIKALTKKYAKRQITWFKKYKNVTIV